MMQQNCHQESNQSCQQGVAHPHSPREVPELEGAKAERKPASRMERADLQSCLPMLYSLQAHALRDCVVLEH